MFDIDFHRRRFLLLAGTTTVTGLAGCTTAPPTAGGQDSSGETTTVEMAPPEGGAQHHDDAPHHQEETHHDDEEHPEEEHDEGLTGPTDSAEVRMVSTDRGNHFEPHVVWVEEGGTVTWTNASGFHSTTSYSPANDRPQLTPDGVEPWNSELLTETDETFEHTFETAGVYHYFCIPHELVGMIGSVIVGTPDPADQRALAEPPVSLPDRVRQTIAQRNSAVEAALNRAS
jgi:plastocyanin